MRVQIIVAAVCAALFWGALTGLTEAAVLLLSEGNPYLDTFVVTDSVFAYSLVWGMTGFASGVVGTFVARRGWRNAPVFFFIFFLLFSILYSVGYWINFVALPEAFSLTSILFDMALLVVLVVIGYVSYRYFSSAFSQDRTKTSSLLNPRNLFVVWLALLIISLTAGFWPAARATEQEVYDDSAVDTGSVNYNVLIILIDTLRKDHMSFYGYERNTTPSMETYFRDGVWFTEAFAQSSHTKPSTASLLTSLYVSAHNTSQLTAGLPREIITAGEVFRALGYRTAMFSVNNFVSPFFGFDQGIEHYFGYRQRAFSATGLYNVLWKTSRKSHVVTRYAARELLRLIESIDLRSPSGGLRQSPISDRNATRAFLRWIDTLGGENFFAYIHYLAPHAPYHPPAPYDRLYVPYPDAKTVRSPRHGGFLPFDEGDPMGERELANMVGQYDGEINYIDAEVGKIMKGLEERGMSDMTLVVLTSDHGEEFYDHHGWGHGSSLFNEVIHVPLIIWQPSLIERRGEITTRIQHIDLLPTLLDILQHPVPEELQGVSFARLLSNSSSSSEDRSVVTELDMGGQGARSIMRNGFKYIYSYYGYKESTMLYDIESDRRELEDISQGKPALADSLGLFLENIREETARDDLKSQQLHFDEDLKNDLKALGYIE